MAKAKWEKVGELRKTKRADMLVGNLELKDLNLKIRVVAFIKTHEQKKNRAEPDIVLLLPKDADEKDVELSDQLFD